MQEKSHTSSPTQFAILITGILLFVGIVFLSTRFNTSNQFVSQNTEARARRTPTPSQPAGMTVTQEQYDIHLNRPCTDVDDSLKWAASGSLQPGQEFIFTPSRPSCRGEVPEVSAELTWDSSTLELSTVVPYPDYVTSDNTQIGQTIIAPNVGNTAHLCMFPNPFDQVSYFYSIKVRNVGNTAATNIKVNGDWEDGWPVFYYHRCLNADADHDGFNDSLERLIGEYSYHYTAYPPDSTKHYTHFVAGNYLKGRGTDAPDDEIDPYLPDFDDNNQINSYDVASVSAHLGEGNGVSLDLIDANPQDPNYIWSQIFLWRRYDLNGDGYVNQGDVNIVQTLVGQPIPMQGDPLSPITHISTPTNNSIISAGAQTIVGAFAEDNESIAKVELYIDGALLCNAIGPNSTAHNPGVTPTPLYYCWWNVPKRHASHTIYSKVYDGAGNIANGPTITVNAQ